MQVNKQEKIIYMIRHTICVVVRPTNMSIPQTFMKWVMWHKLSKDNKAKRVNLKCQLLFSK